jgi:hypothetical protein
MMKDGEESRNLAYEARYSTWLPIVTLDGLSLTSTVVTRSLSPGRFGDVQFGSELRAPRLGSVKQTRNEMVFIKYCTCC